MSRPPLRLDDWRRDNGFDQPPRVGDIDPDTAAQLTLARSWYRVRRDGDGWIIEEHRVGEHAEVREHHCASHGEVNRIRNRLTDEGLIGYGEAL